MGTIVPTLRRFPSQAPERVRIYHSTYYQRHRERLRKEQQDKVAADPEKFSKYHREWYLRNRPRILKRDNERRAINRAAIRSAKNKPCADCGKIYPHYVMDFDHVKGKKEHNVSQMQGYVNLTVLLEEMAKCELVCANCHRQRTFSRRQLVKPHSPWSRKGPFGSGLIVAKKRREG